MYSSLIFAGGLVITLFAACVVVRYLSGPLRKQLQELCGNQDRAEFWTAFSNVSVILTPLIFALSGDSPAGPGVPQLPILINQLRWGLIGLVVSVLLMGWILSRFIPKTIVVSGVNRAPVAGGVL